MPSWRGTAETASDAPSRRGGVGGEGQVARARDPAFRDIDLDDRPSWTRLAEFLGASFADRARAAAAWSETLDVDGIEDFLARREHAPVAAE